MRVFCLSTGRCGSTTFTESFSHATNFTSGHETRTTIVGPGRFDYPDQHVESDNRLSWFLGDLEAKFGDLPLYVHLTRNEDDVVRSFQARHKSHSSIMRGFGRGILMNARQITAEQWREVARMYVRTVTTNIEYFLVNKSNVVRMRLEDPEQAVREIWQRAGMEGDLEAALAAWQIRYNASP